ncbi:MAG: PQQ-dependent sugar dehydrogenase [Myxococcota bacterium]
MNTRLQTRVVSNLLALVAGFLCFAPGALAQECALGSRVPFAGHNLPLDADPNPQSMTLVEAFPNLGFDRAIQAVPTPDDTNRLAVVEQEGQIRIFQNDASTSSLGTFLDISGVVDDSDNEMGLLGLAFDPGYAQNGRFFVNYTAGSACSGAVQTTYCTRIVQYEVSAGNANVANPGSASLVYEFEQTASFHNGGTMHFGPDGYLYVAAGDGGLNSSDALDLTNPRGAILRLDVSENAPSLAPSTNPFVGQAGAAEEIFHYGLRNPWRFSFDSATGDLWIGDVGRASFEEINFLAAGSPGGTNFGWDRCEGNGDGPANQACGSQPYEAPAYVYAHGGAAFNSVTGGFVYRGDEFPELNGAYIFADYGLRTVWAWDKDGGGSPQQIATADNGIVSFGEDNDGEILLLELFGNDISRLARSSGSGGSGGDSFPIALSDTGFFDNVSTLTPAAGMIEYEPEAPFYSDNTEKTRWMALPGNQKIAFHATETWGFPVGTAFVKHFEIERSDGSFQRLETRVFLRQLGRWVGVTYRWNSAGTDAFLLVDGDEVVLDLGAGQTQNYIYPSSSDCLGCHNDFAGRALGLRTRQLGGEFDYGSVSEVQLEAWNCIGLFDTDLENPTGYERFAPFSDSSRSLSHRVRSHVDVNCAVCHQPAGPAPTAVDLRFDTAIAEMNLIGASPTEGNLGVPGADLVTVGSKEDSGMWLRMSSLVASERMAAGTQVPDAEAVAEIGSWIDSALNVIDTDEDGIADGADLCPTVADPGQADRDGDDVGDACDPDDLPDVFVVSQNVPSSVSPGQLLSLSAVARNQGGGAAGNFPLNFYLSSDQSFDRTEDASVGTCWLNGAGVDVSRTCTTTEAQVPSDIVAAEALPAEFYWVACADPVGQIPDVDDSNDCLVASSPVMVPEPGVFMLGLVALSSTLVAVRLRRALD